MSRPNKRQYATHKAESGHKRENPLRDVILGGQDGLVNSLGIILGVSAVSDDVHILIATVLAALFAESIAMGAVAYTSAIAQKDYYEAERKKEEWEVDNQPEMEREEVREIYAEKGFSGKVLDEIVQTLTANKKIWVDIMMKEELNLQPVETRAVLKSAVIVFFATAIGHFLPLIPFFFTAHLQAVILAIVISGLTLFGTGVYQAVTLIGSWWKVGLKMVLIGLGAATIGYFIASLFHTGVG